MKILFLSNFGMGLYKFRKELIQELIREGHEIYVSLPNDDYVVLLEKIGCKYIESKLDRRGINPLSDLKLLISYIYIINKIKPDIVLSYTVKPNIYGGIACRLTNTSFLPNITGLGTAVENKGTIQQIIISLYKVALKYSTCVFFQNESNKKFFIDRNIIKNKTKVIPGSGVNLSEHNFEIYPNEEEIIRFLFLGRIMKAKGIDELLLAAKQIEKKYKNVEFHLVGFCEEEYSGKMREINSQDFIQYHGQQHNIHRYIKNSHAIILPSYHEGTSNVLLEAAATGRPILASNVPGCIETFDEGISGFGFEPRNSDSLTQAIIKFIELPVEKKEAMGQAGRKKVEKEFDRSIVVDAYLKEIDRILGEI